MNWKSFQRCSVNNSLSSAEATVIQRDWVPLSTPYFSLCLHFLYSFFSVHLSLSDTHHSALWIKCDAINQNSRGIIVCSAHFNWDCAQIVQEITSFFLLFCFSFRHIYFDLDRKYQEVKACCKGQFIRTWKQKEPQSSETMTAPTQASLIIWKHVADVGQLWKNNASNRECKKWILDTLSQVFLLCCFTQAI